MRSALAHAAQIRAGRRSRSASLSTVPPAETSEDYDSVLATTAASILYKSPLPSQAGRAIYILNAAAFPDATDSDYDKLLSYVLARLPSEEELISGTEYEIVFFAGGQEGATTEKRVGPGVGWYLHSYNALSRATRKKLQQLYIVHPRTWVRVLVGIFGAIVSPKFRRKIVHVNTLSALALQIPIETLLIPPSVYLHDRKLSPEVYAPYVTGKRAFGVRHPLPKNLSTGVTRLPRVLRETTNFILDPINIQREGLFRIPPNATLSSALKEAYDRGQHFIVWKEKGVTVVEPGIDESLVEELRIEDSYGVHQAASLIKQWYRDLRKPIFPPACYEVLSDKYHDSETPVTPEDLVEMIFIQSEISPLSEIARDILTRHLLPLLSEVAAREAENKMNAENLAVCFAMCLLCGPSQVEDAKISSIIRRILKAAIEMWPDLREGMGISVEAFHDGLRAPGDWRDYEDPLEESLPPPGARTDNSVHALDMDSHRIHLQDIGDDTTSVVALPSSSLVAERASPPTLPPRPLAAPTIASAPTAIETATAIPRRKPVPPVLEPPRYSTIFLTSNECPRVADSPLTLDPASGFGPPRLGTPAFDEGSKKGFAPLVLDHPLFESRKERSISAGQPRSRAQTDPVTRSSSDGSVLARMDAEHVTAESGHAPVIGPSSEQHRIDSISTTGTSSSIPSETDGVFRKPLWPASARPQSLAKPMSPPRHSQTFPMLANDSQATAANVSRPRAPSPSLLQRMQSFGVDSDAEVPSSTHGELESQGLGLKKPSVEDLKRLYEERLNTALGLAKADAAKRDSTASR